MKNKILAIDFDGTVVNHEFPYIGELRPDAHISINSLYNLGYKICIWTCRTSQFFGNLPKDSAPTVFHAKEFLDKVGIPYHTINNNIPELNFQPSPKIYADVYIDDKNLGGFIPWATTYEMITGEKLPKKP